MTRHSAVAVFAVAAVLIGGCGGADGNRGLLEQMRSAGYARVPLAQTPPYTAISPSGQASGYLVDVARLVLGRLGVPDLRVTTTTYDAMIPALQAGQYDLLPGALNITQARCRAILFTQPVTVQHEALAVPAGNPKQLTAYTDVAADRSVRLAVLSGSSQQSFARAQGVPADRMVAVPDAQTGIAAVTSGRADAFAAGQFTLQAQRDGGGAAIEVVVDLASKLSGVGIGFRPSDRDARDEFDRVLTELRQDGSLQRLYEQAGFTNPELLTTVTRADIAAECR